MERSENSKSSAASIQEILKERARLEKMLKEEFSKHVAVMFTDIKGSTQFFENHGDMVGFEMINRHNDLLFPLIEEKGSIVKTIGDAIMACFENPEDAVTTAIAMQIALQKYNQTLDNPNEEIHIRIGINYGVGIVDKKDDGRLDVYGDVVNTAARVESGGGKATDQILISQPVYDAVRNSEEIICRYYDSVEAKGKAEPLEIYRVVWDPEAEKTTISDQTTRSATGANIQHAPRLICFLTLSRDGDQVRIMATERRENDFQTVRQHETISISDKELTVLAQAMFSALPDINASNTVSKKKLMRLRKAGQALYNRLFTPHARDLIQSTQASELTIILDDQLIQIPWELCHDGDQFLCLKFNIGRLVSTAQPIAGIKIRQIATPLKMLILSDPLNNLPAARQEGEQIFNTLENEDPGHYLISARLEKSPLKTKNVLRQLYHYDLVHYAGHADYNDDNPSSSGWLMRDGKLTTSHIMATDKQKTAPSLVFANSCQSGQTGTWRLDTSAGEYVFGMASAFLLTGVQHYIGALWDVLDQPSFHFSAQFYKELLKGAPVGEALRKARISLIQKYGEETLVWASYVLYGNPSFRYLNRQNLHPNIEAPRQVTDDFDTPLIDAETEATHVKKTKVHKPKKIKRYLALASIALILTVIGIVAIFPDILEIIIDNKPGIYEQGIEKLRGNDLDEAQRLFETIIKTEPDLAYEGLAAVSFFKNDYRRANELAEKALELNPSSAYPVIIKGQLLLATGKMQAAEKFFQKAVGLNNISPWQLSSVHNGIGRILSTQGQIDEALKHYDQAISLDASNAETFSNKGVVLAKMGRNEEAIQAYRNAIRLNPKDLFVQNLLRDLEKRRQDAANQEQKQRIQALIKDLADSYRQNKPVGNQKDANIWTSKPITLFLTPFSVKGIASRDGETDVFTTMLSDSLIETGRIIVVERDILEKLLEELKLGSSELADKKTALKIGRVLGARLITTGKIRQSGGFSHVSMRLVETETTAIKGAFRLKLDLSDPLAEESVKSLADKMMTKIKKIYPLRGVIADVKDDNHIVVNIGAKQGVVAGMIMTIIKEGETITSGDQVLGRHKIETGRMEITSVEDNLCYGKVLEKTTPIEKEMKVQEVIKTL